MPFDRRAFLLGAGAAVSATAIPADAVAALHNATSFPKNFLWGAATAGHQIEGNNVNSDSWLLENCKPTIFREPSLDAANSFELWATDLDLVKSLGLNSYRFSLEWARIEPVEGMFSIAMLDHYKAIIEGCRHRGLVPVVTFNHFTTPRWFAAQGGWTNPKSPALFARYCETAARHLGALIGYATTLNEPNVCALLAATIPAFAKPRPLSTAMMAAAAHASGSDRFVVANIAPLDVASAMLPNMIAAHKAGRAAIKSVRPSLPVGVSLAIADDQAVGSTVKRDQVRADSYGAWLDAAKGDDFIGVQNYERNQWNETGKMPVPPDAPHNYLGAEVYPPSLAGAVRYAHQRTGCPVIVTEHGVGTDDDRIRAALIPAALKELKVAMDEGVPVYGYLHWSLLDNFEWSFGFRPKFGLCAVDRTTFERTPKPSSAVLGAIARRNALKS